MCAWAHVYMICDRYISHGPFSRIDHLLSNKVHVSKLKKCEIIPSIFSEHNDIKFEINNMMKTGKFTDKWKLNNTLQDNQWVKEDKREIKEYLDKNKKGNTTY